MYLAPVLYSIDTFPPDCEFLVSILFNTSMVLDFFSFVTGLVAVKTYFPGSKLILSLAVPFTLVLRS